MTDAITPRFLDYLDARLLDDIPATGQNSRWMLLADFRYESAVLGARIIVPSGFVTDFASVPKQVPLAYALFADQARRPAVVHDYLYQTHMCRDKAQADEIFEEAMNVIGMHWLDRHIMWRAVEAAGDSAWASGPVRYTVLQSTRPSPSPAAS